MSTAIGPRPFCPKDTAIAVLGNCSSGISGEMPQELNELQLWNQAVRT